MLVSPRRLLVAACVVAAIAMASSCSQSSRPAGGSSPTVSPSTGLDPSPVPSQSTSTSLHAFGLLLLQKQGGPVEICVGPVALTAPPQCDQAVRAIGLDWTALPWKQTQSGVIWAAEVALTGSYTGDGFNVTSATRGTPPASTSTPPTPPDPLCSTASGDPAALLPPNVDMTSTLESSPGFQGAWVTPGPAGTTAQTLNVATRGDQSALERLARARYSGPLCIGTVSGPTRAAISDAEARLRQARAELGLVSAAATVSGSGSELAVVVVVRTPQVEQRARALVSPEVGNALRLQPIFA